MSQKAEAKATQGWSTKSWRQKPIKQQPNYPDHATLDEVEKRLAKLAPLVHPHEVRLLRKDLAKVAQGKAFLLQGGDCAESFAEYNDENLRNYFRVMLQMTVALMYGTGLPVVKVGRIAGQFAKPRSADLEKQGDIELPSYRGDMVNSVDFNEKSRIPDPERLVSAYNQSAATLNFLRSLAKGGFASLNNVNRWNQEFASQCAQGQMFDDLVSRINESLSFIEALGIETDRVSEIQQADFYTSHEGLLLNYEEAFTRYEELDDSYYNCSAHMLWIGDRTRSLDEAHIEFFRGIANPIGVKAGPTTNPADLVKLIETLNPNNEPGKVTVITRMGADKVAELLPPIIRKVKEEGQEVIWSCDPMHGNTIKSPNGYKTRPFNQVLAEVTNTFEIHRSEGTHAGGIHIEMTGQNVTECVGGAQAISEVDLKDRYHTHCDPRLNASQSVELAFLISQELRNA